MRKLAYFSMFAVCMTPFMANAEYSDKQFRAEVLEGLDIIGARANVDVIPDEAPGAMGLEVYQTADAVSATDVRMFIPTSMYLRAGAGLNLNFATDKATFANHEYKTADSYTTQIGLGWNLSSYVRTELDFQESTFKFSHLDDAQATYQTIGATLYFDLARRYVMTGDITRRRTFVPFIGVGAGIGHYEFEGTNGANGLVIAAPRATIGFNIMFNDLIGVDIAYQYQMMIGDGFGWGVHGGVDNISNVMASFRVNF